MKYIKNYLLPTQNWLKPLEIIYHENNLMIDTTIKLNIKNNKLIIKIIKVDELLGKQYSESNYNIIKNSPVVIQIYNFLNYDNSLKLFDFIGYDKVVLEIMKKYKKSLNNYINKLEIYEFQYVLRYLLMIQLELFNFYGFVHNNIQLGNVMIESNKKEIIFYIYRYNLKPQKIISPYKLVLSDFENSKILFKSLNPEIINFYKDKSNIKYENCLEFNIINTFNQCLNLLKNNEIHKQYLSIIESYQVNKRYPVKILSSFSRCEYNEQRFKEAVISNCIGIISDLFNLLFGDKYLFLT